MYPTYPSVQRTSWVVGVCTPVGQLYATTVDIMFSRAHSFIALSNGVPVSNVNVWTNETITFYYPVTTSGDISVTVTTVYGDPDLVASFSNPNPYCLFLGSLEYCYNYTYIVNQFGDETLVIPAASIPATASSLYMGVFGFTNSTFSIVVSQGNGSVADHINLMDGVPQAGRVSAQTVCATRDNTTLQCTSPSSTQYGTWYRYIHDSDHHFDFAYLMLDKFCGNDTTNVNCDPAFLDVRVHALALLGVGWFPYPTPQPPPPCVLLGAQLCCRYSLLLRLGVRHWLHPWKLHRVPAVPQLPGC